MNGSLILSLNNSVLTNSELTLNEELLKKYANWLQVEETSKQTYLINANKFINWLGVQPLNENTILNYRTYLISKYKGTTINTHIASLKSLFNYIELQGGTNLARNLKNVKVSNNFKRDVLTIEQVASIYKKMNTATVEQARTNAIIRLFIGTGLRECELINANIGDMKPRGNKNVLYIQGKGYNNARENKEEYVYLECEVLNAIQDYLKFRPNAKDNEPLFSSLSNRNTNQRLTTRTIRNIVKNTFRENGIVSERITTHSLRHTCCTFSLLNGATLQEVQTLARHSKIETTMIYAHNINRDINHAESKVNDYIRNHLKESEVVNEQ